MSTLSARLRAAFAVAAFAAVTLLSSGQALAEDRHVRIINETEHVMVRFYASNISENDWQEDILGQRILASGASVNINIDDGTGYCLYDFKAVFDDGEELVRKKIDVCKISSYRFTPTTPQPTGAAQTEDRHVRIINETDYAMVRFYASNISKGDWEEDILGQSVLASGASVNINIDDGSGFCLYDFKAVFDDGDELVRKKVDVCKISSYRYTED